MAETKALLTKEFREELRSSKWNLVLILLLALYQQFFALQNYASAFRDSPDLLRSIVSYSILYLAPIIIPFYGNSVMSRSLQRERLNRSLLILMTTGIRPERIWRVKTLAAFLISYAIYLICAACDIGLIVWGLKLPFEFSAVNVAGALLLSPLLAGALLIVLSFMYWSFRNTVFVTTGFTMLMTFGVWGISMQKPMGEFNLTLLGIGCAVSPAVLLAICSLLIRRQAKWKAGAI